MSEVKINSTVINNSGVSRLTQEEISKLCDGDKITTAFSVSGVCSVVLEIDLGTRYILDRVVYYYSGGSITIEASESEGLWYNLDLYYSYGYCYSAGLPYKPRWLRISHTCTTSALGREIEVYSGHNNVLFGSSGTFYSFGIDSSGTIVEEVPVYNNTADTKDLFLFIDSDGYFSGSIKYSTSSSGIFYSLREVGLSLPNIFPFDYGRHINTVFDGTGLTISGSSVSGTYYSPVLNVSDHENSRFYCTSYQPAGSKIDYFFSGVQSGCFGMRRFYIPPSGSWSSGRLSEDYDYYWSVPSGSLPFYPIKNDDFIDIVPGFYIQFAVTITGSTSDKPVVYSVGIEDPLTLCSVGGYSTASAYITTTSGMLSGGSANLLCFSKDV